MSLLSSYQLWLNNFHYSKVTTKNYLADLSRYFSYLESRPQTISLGSPQIFSSSLILPYVDSLVSNPNKKRYLSSLNLFCQFAVDQNIVGINPLKETIQEKKSSLHKDLTLTELTQAFKSHLESKNTPSSTVRNYINDLNQYISWLDTQIDA